MFKSYALKCKLVAVLLLLSAMLLFSGASYAQEGGQRVRCVVLDPGHGGHDHGCMSKDRRYSEKNIVLSVALRLGKLIEDEHPDVKVIYTRKKDVFIPLAERADIANRNKADLFISIHVNANTSTVPNGCETYTMGAHVSNRNFEVSKRENSVIKMEDDYTTRYEGFNPDSPESYIIFTLLQNAYSEQSIKLASFIQDEYRKGPVFNNRGVRQAGFLVLWRTTMPSVLTEIGFLTNDSDKARIITAEGQQKIARRLADAFTRYCQDYEALNSGQTPPDAPERLKIDEPEPEPTDAEKAEEHITEAKAEEPVTAEKAEEPVTEAKEDITEASVFAIQIMASKKRLPAASSEFKGLSPVVRYYSNNFYKYCYGNFSSQQEAASKLPQVRKKFKDAFVVEIKNGKIVRK